MKVQEFSRKFLEPQWSDRHQQYITTGFEQEIGFETQAVPEEIRKAVSNNELRSDDNYGPPEGQISLVAKELNNYSVLVVANKLMDDGARPLVGNRYFWVEKNESNPEIDGIKTLLNWWEEKGKPQLDLKPNVEQEKELKQRQQSDYYEAKPLTSQKSRLKIKPPKNNEPLVIENPTTIEEVHSVSLQIKNAGQSESIAWAWNARNVEKPKSFTVISPVGLATEKILTPPTIEELKKKETEISKENTPTHELNIGDKVKLGYVPGAVKNLQTGMEVTVNAPSHLRGGQEMIELKKEDHSTFLWSVENLEKVEVIESEARQDTESSVITKDGKAEKEETEVTTSSVQNPPRSKTSKKPQKPDNQDKGKDEMLTDSAKPEIKATGDNVQEIQGKTVLLAAQLTQLILKKIKENPSLKKDLKIELDEPANVNIYVGDELKYQSREGANPEVNQLKKEQLELINQALQMKVGDSINSQSNITITVNNKPILEVRNGVVEKNDLQAELVGQLSQGSSQEKETADRKPKEIPIENMDESQEKETANREPKEIPIENMDESQEKETANREPKEIPIENMDESQEKETINREPKEIPIENMDESQEKETINRKPKEITLENPEQSQEKDNNQKEVQVTQIEVANEPLQIEPKTAAHEKQTSPDLEPETLSKQGIEPNLVREALEQVPNKNSPVIIIVNNNQDKNKLAEATKNAPRNTKVGLLQRVKDFVRQKTPEPISRAVNTFVRPFRNEQARQRDLNGLNTLITSKKLLQEFGAKNQENQKFTTGTYQFQQEKDASIKVTDAQRGVLFNYDANTGRIITNNLEKGDINALNEMKEELNNYQQNRRGRQQERTQEKEVLEVA
ncbi:MAG: hypothetical protein QNJ33_17670 [Crocosphaera sp.]|nr:hypothetical protein [Crocosphaera sp.]